MVASDNLNPEQFTHVPLSDLPVTDYGHKGPLPHPYAVSKDDDPRGYPSHFPAGSTFSLRHVPLADLNRDSGCPGGVHGAHCYAPGSTAKHDIDPESDDAVYVRHMAKHADHLPALVGTSSTQYFGGGHRTAAFHEAGRTHIPMWVKD
jgi:hypothetical protein